MIQTFLDSFHEILPKTKSVICLESGLSAGGATESRCGPTAALVAQLFWARDPKPLP